MNCKLNSGAEVVQEGDSECDLRLLCSCGESTSFLVSIDSELWVVSCLTSSRSCRYSK